MNGQKAEAASDKSFIVYFDFDQSTLTGRAREIVRQAASHALSSGAESVLVYAHTDRAGSDNYNQKLSERRAKTVRDALIARGLPAEMVRAEAFGETQPVSAMEDGVADPLNRRAEVTIRLSRDPNFMF